MRERFTAIPAAYLILERKDQILLMRRANTGYQDGNYGLPSGHLEKGETPKKAAVREGFEEAGVTLKPELLRLSTMVYNTVGNVGGEHYMAYFFSADIGDQEPLNKEPDKCDEMGWYPKDQLPDNLTPDLKRALENIEKR